MSNAMIAHDLALKYIFDMRMLEARAKTALLYCQSKKKPHRRLHRPHYLICRRRRQQLYPDKLMSRDARITLTTLSKRYIKANSLHSLSLAARPSKTTLRLGASPVVFTTFTPRSSLRLLVYRNNSQHSSSLCPSRLYHHHIRYSDV